MKKSAPILLYVKIKNRVAVGRRVPGGFVVYAGSEAAPEGVPSCPDAVASLRSALVRSGVLVPDNGRLVFAHDFTFSSPSIAASAVAGANMNGPGTWKTRQGVALGELR